MAKKIQSTKFPHSYSLIKEHAVDINSLPLQLYHEEALLSNPIFNQLLLLSVGKLLCPHWLWWAPDQAHVSHPSEAF